jgi:hypothetical protein
MFGDTTKAVEEPSRTRFWMISMVEVDGGYIRIHAPLRFPTAFDY